MKTHPGFDGKVIRQVYFIELDLLSGMFRCNTSDRNITVDGDIYYAVGVLGKIGEYTTTSGTTATALKFTLTGIPSDMTGEVANENTRNRPVKVAIALLDQHNQLAADLIWWFSGTINSLSMDIGQSVSIAASASSRLINWARSVNSRYTHEDQQSRYPGDKGFAFIADMTTLKLRWGS